MAQDLTDTQWALIEPLLPELPRRPAEAKDAGRPCAEALR